MSLIAVYCSTTVSIKGVTIMKARGYPEGATVSQGSKRRKEGLRMYRRTIMKCRISNKMSSLYSGDEECQVYLAVSEIKGKTDILSTINRIRMIYLVNTIRRLFLDLEGKKATSGAIAMLGNRANGCKAQEAR